MPHPIGQRQAQSHDLHHQVIEAYWPTTTTIQPHLFAIPLRASCGRWPRKQHPSDFTEQAALREWIKLCTSSSANLGKHMVGQEHLFRAKYLLNLLGPQGRPRDPRRPCPNEWHQSQRQHTSRTPSAAGGKHGNCASMCKPCASHGAKAMIPPMARNSAFLE